MKRYFYTLLHLFYPAGIEPLRVNQTQSICNVQPCYSAGDLPAKENAQMIKKLVLTVLIVLATLTLATCAPRASTILSPEEATDYAAEVKEIVENMIVGDSECNYAMFTRDLSPEAREGVLDESAWQQKCEANRGVYGAYLSKTLDHVEDRGRDRVVIYHVVFENDPDVTLEVNFRSDNPDHLIIDIDWQV